MVVVIVSPSKRFLFECRADLLVREIFTLTSFSENVFSNNLPALCTEVLRDCGALVVLFLAVRLRVLVCFFSAHRKQAYWFLFTKRSAFPDWLRVKFFQSVQCSVRESRTFVTIDPHVQKHVRFLTGWEFNFFNLFSALCEKAEHFVSFPLTENRRVGSCLQKEVRLFTDWELKFFQSVHCSVRESRTFVTIGKHAQKHVHFLCSVWERGTRVKLATPA